ncbi:TauD/TfdA family dioxygenase [Acinetobacter baylyi]|uniref:TauD/TfdA family dioxygenase n=1 Tax=Acinetobacter baylyi TaxID=202950 RepID=UPI000EA1A3D6|nr:TauD/TfdA family dioxygenase [Acinetobacter baylyi]
MELLLEPLCSFAKLYQAKNDNNQFSDLKTLFESFRVEIFDQLHQTGILVFRGFQIHNIQQFEILVQQSLQLKAWNAFNPNLPGWLASLMRKYSENLLGAGDYRRYLGKNTVQLGPVDNSVQGPHVEGGIQSTRCHYLSLYCQEPSEYLAETGFNDLQQIWQNFDRDTQNYYQTAWNYFYYVSSRPINLIDKLLLKNSPFQVEQQPDKTAKLILEKSPLVIYHPETKKPCLQPWAFAKNTNSYAHQAAIHQFEGRGEIVGDATANGMNLSWEMRTSDGENLNWSDSDKSSFFNNLYKDAFLLNWEKGDIALVDNIKIAHWRMNGQQGKRQLIQIQANVFNAEECLNAETSASL